MRALLLVALAPLVGCPHLPGTWADYDLPEEAAVVGMLFRGEGVGGYWSGDVFTTPVQLWWAWLHEPEDLHAWSRFAPGLGDCQIGEVTRDLVIAPGRADATLRAEGLALELADTGEGMLYFGTALSVSDYLHDATYELDLDIEGEEPLAFSPFIETPGALSWTAPPVHGDAPATLSSPEVTFEWEPVDADMVLVEVSPYAGSTILESAYCLVTDTGAFDFPMGMLSTLPQADGLMLSVGAVTETARRIPDHEAGSRMTALHLQVGLVFLP